MLDYEISSRPQVIGSIEMIAAEFVAIATTVLPQLRGSKISALAERLADADSQLPDVVGEGKSSRIQGPDKRISWGLARRKGKFVVVILSERENSRSLSEAEDIAKSFPGLVETKVIGGAYSVNPGDMGRKPLAPPLYPGSSIGHIRGFPGTVGCVAQNRLGKESWIGVTSASHVLSILNTAKKGDPIIAPGHPDGPKSSASRCGSLDRYIFLTHYSKVSENTNHLCCSDMAFVQIDEEYEGQIPDGTWVISPSTEQQMRIKGIVSRDKIFERSGEAVYKVGRTTDLTQGTLDLVRLQRQSIQLPDGKLYIYTDVMTVERIGEKAFSKPGDSGALVYTADAFALGFVIGGTDKTTWVAPIDQCLRDINAEIVL
jgi:hypothetical protein